MLDRRVWLQAVAALGVLPEAWAQGAATRRGKSNWPDQGVNLIVPFPAGGTSSILGKHLSQAFERQTQQSMRLQYLGGSGGQQGAAYAAKSAGNGQYLFIGGSALAMVRGLADSEEFDLLEDLLPLAMVAEVPQVVVVNPARMRARTVVEWLADLGRKPARYRMATAGMGSSSHLAAEVLKRQQALNFEFVHFRGAAPALQDLLTGTADMMIDGLVSCLPHIRSGRLKPLMVTGKHRAHVLPDVPCAQEVGLHILDSVTWYGLFAPRQLPERQARSMVEVFQRMEQDEVLAAQLEAMGIRWGAMYGEAFADLVKQETQDWAQRLKGLGMQKMVRNVEEV